MRGHAQYACTRQGLGGSGPVPTTRNTYASSSAPKLAHRRRSALLSKQSGGGMGRLRVRHIRTHRRTHRTWHGVTLGHDVWKVVGGEPHGRRSGSHGHGCCCCVASPPWAGEALQEPCGYVSIGTTTAVPSKAPPQGLPPHTGTRARPPGSWVVGRVSLGGSVRAHAG